MPRLLRAGVGFAAGAACAGLGWWLGQPAVAEPAADTTIAPVPVTTTVAVVTEPDWVLGGGARFESVVIRPLELDVTDGGAVLEYEIVGLAASAFELFIGPAESPPPVLPEVWRLTVSDGRSVEASVAPPAPVTVGETQTIRGSVRFDELPAGADEDEIVEIAVVGWRVATPVVEEIGMSAEVGSAARLFDGTSIVLDTVIEQRSGSILDFDVDSLPNPWRVSERFPFGASTAFEGTGPGWLRASSTIGGTGLTGGATGFQLRWSELEVPPSFVVRYTTVAWTPLAGELIVVSEGTGD